MQNAKLTLLTSALLLGCSLSPAPPTAADSARPNSSSTSTEEDTGQSATDISPRGNTNTDTTATAGGGAPPDSGAEKPTGALDTDKCPASQWVCRQGCENIIDPSAMCWCEPERPVHLEDCEEDTVFVCRRAYDYTAVSASSVLKEIECNCVPKTKASCLENSWPLEKTARTLLCDGPCIVDPR